MTNFFINYITPSYNITSILIKNNTNCIKYTKTRYRLGIHLHLLI